MYTYIYPSIRIYIELIIMFYQFQELVSKLFEYYWYIYFRGWKRSDTMLLSWLTRRQIWVTHDK